MAACEKPSVRRECEVRMKISDAACSKKMQHLSFAQNFALYQRVCYEMWWKRTSTQINAKVLSLKKKNMINEYIKLYKSMK